MLAFTLTACGNTQGNEGDEKSKPSSQTEETSNTQAASKKPKEEGKNLVVYFSVPETDSPDNMNEEEENSTVVVDGKVLGNTQYVAYLIQEELNTDIFRIEPTAPYPMDHAELEAVATQESRDAALPEISAVIEEFEQYDTVFVGYPIWYSDMPRILYTLFESYDFSGKTIVPFITSGASGFSGTIKTIQELEPEATVIEDGYSITRNRMEDAESEVEAWISEIGY